MDLFATVLDFSNVQLSHYSQCIFFRRMFQFHQSRIILTVAIFQRRKPEKNLQRFSKSYT
jgi:hypothetical protein